MEYILSVGTNLGDRLKNINNCIQAINLVPYTDVIKKSRIYETEPVGYARQNDFYNIILLVESILEPNEMLGMCLGIEGAFGRERTIRNGPRVLDIDIILAENEQIETRNLSIPHPRYTERRFVLEPMLDIFPDGKAYGTDFKKYIAFIDGQRIKPIEEK